SERVVGCVALQEDADNTNAAPVDGLPPVLGTLDHLLELIERHGVRTVHFDIPLHASAVVEELYFKLLDEHVAIHWVPDIFSLRLINHSVREIAGVPVLTLSETPLTGTRRLVKSLEDVILGSLICLAAVPVLGLVALAVRLDSPGP